LNPEGFNNILAIRSSINRGISPSLKALLRLPNITPIVRPKIEIKNIPDPV
jgi:hypothetical protein